MRAETRHQLKQDKFSRRTLEVAEATAHWSAEHRTKVIAGAVIALVLVGSALGAWYVLNQEDEKASAELSQAVRTLDTQLRPPGTPPDPEFPSFDSAKARATEAQKQFQPIVDKYGHTRSGEIARYFLGLTSSQLGDNAAAERDLKAVSNSRDKDLAGLAKFALASVYRNANRNQEAIDLYNQLIQKPSTTVSKSMAQLALGDTYESEQKAAEAKQIYQQIQKENPNTEIAQLATAKLQELK